MARPVYTGEALVLRHEGAGERHQRLALLEPEQGGVLALFRPTRGSYSPGLFDRIRATLEAKAGGGATFARDVELLERPEFLARDYRALQRAADFARVMTLNLGHWFDAAALHALTREYLEGLRQAGKADVAYLKALYRLGKMEGYPVKEAWAPTLPGETGAVVAELLATPLAQVEVVPRGVEEVVANLEAYLRHHTAIRME